jgi:hypothetical protein
MNINRHYFPYSAIVTVAFLLVAVPSLAADCVIKDIAQNDKVLVQDVTCAPGAMSPMAKRPLRVVTALTPAEFKRTYDDGTTEMTSFKDHETKILDVAKAYSFVNAGKAESHLISVTIK